MELTIKELAPYLPYGLKIFDGEYQREVVFNHATYNINEIGVGRLLRPKYDFSMGLPILRPLSDLTNPISHNGETFVPMDWFSKNIRKGLSFYKPISINLPLQIDVETENYSQTIDIFDGYLIVQKLAEWHFDFQGLLENNLAINLNTIQQ